MVEGNRPCGRPPRRWTDDIVDWCGSCQAGEWQSEVVTDHLPQQFVWAVGLCPLWDANKRSKVNTCIKKMHSLETGCGWILGWDNWLTLVVEMVHLCVFMSIWLCLSRYTLCILTSYVKKTVPELELALQHIQALKGCYSYLPTYHAVVHSLRLLQFFAYVFLTLHETWNYGSNL